MPLISRLQMICFASALESVIIPSSIAPHLPDGRVQTTGAMVLKRENTSETRSLCRVSTRTMHILILLNDN